MFIMGPVHARDNGPGLSGTEPERTARHRDLLYARRSYNTPEQEQSVTVPHRIYLGDYSTPGQAGKGVGVPVHPSETPGGLQVESYRKLYNICMATINTEAISIPINFPHPGVSCLNITESQIIMFTGYSQMYNIHGYPITGVNRSIISGVMSGSSLFQGFKYTGVQEYKSLGVPNVW